MDHVICNAPNVKCAKIVDAIRFNKGAQINPPANYKHASKNEYKLSRPNRKKPTQNSNEKCKRTVILGEN